MSLRHNMVSIVEAITELYQIQQVECKQGRDVSSSQEAATPSRDIVLQIKNPNRNAGMPNEARKHATVFDLSNNKETITPV